MKIEKVNINNLVSPDYNPRQITPDELEKLKRSIDEFGYIDPIIVNKHNNHIVGGNQRFEAMKQLGYTEVEVSYVNITDPNREKALNLRLNKASGDWDTLKLNEILEELEINHFDINLTGFDEFDEEIEFKNLLSQVEYEDKPVSKPKPKIEDESESKSEEESEQIFDEESETVNEKESEPINNKPAYYQITLLFDTEEEMTEAFDKLVSDGYNCRMSKS